MILIRLFLKKLKKFHKKIIFFIILLAIILLPLKYPFSAMAKLRQFSHFLQQINKSLLYPFSKIQTRAPSLFPFVLYSNLHKSKTPIKYDCLDWAYSGPLKRVSPKIPKKSLFPMYTFDSILREIDDATHTFDVR